MPLAGHLVAGTRDFSAAAARDAGNTLRAAQELWVRTPTGIVKVLGQLSVSLSGGPATGSVNRSTTATVTTRVVTAVPNGGVAPYSYAWTRTDGGPHAWTINAPTNAGTAFSTSVASNAEQTADFLCTVTDATGATATVGLTADCWNDGGGL